MMVIMAIQKMTTAPGERCILEPESSLNLVNPPPLEGMVILLSAIGYYFNIFLIILSEFL